MEFPDDNHLSDDDLSDGCQSDGQRWWLFPLLLVGVLLVALLARSVVPFSAPGEQQTANTDTLPSWTPTSRPEGESVGLTIDFGNGASRVFDALPWQEGMTVRDVMAAAADFRPAIRFEQMGQGATALLTSLEGVANQGAAGRNWLYRIDQQHGQVSFAVQRLQPGQRVLWSFGHGE